MNEEIVDQQGNEAWEYTSEIPEGTELYEYTACGLDDVFLIGGVKKVATSEGDGVIISDQDALHRTIGKFLVTEKPTLSGKELRFLRKEMNYTQSELGRFIGLSAQQVARWEKCVSEITQSADYLLRKLYLEHINGGIALKDLVDELQTKDSGPRQQHLFSSSEGLWRPVAA